MSGTATAADTASGPEAAQHLQKKHDHEQPSSSSSVPASQLFAASSSASGVGASTSTAPENPLDTVGSLFSGWMSSASAAAAAAAAAAASAATAAAAAAAGENSADGRVGSSGASSRLGASGRPSADGTPAVADRSTGNQSGVVSGGHGASASSESAVTGPLDPNAWLAGAGKMWESALRDVGQRIESVKLDEKVAGLRDSSTSFLDDVSKNLQTNLHIDPDVLRQRADELQISTKELLASASEKIHERTREAIDIFVDKGEERSSRSSANVTDNTIGYAPWDKASLPEAEHKYADKLREEMLKLVVDSIYSKKKRTDYFLSGAATRAKFKFDADANAAAAIAALQADQNMRRLRAGLVPQKISESVFWDEYFYRVSHVRAILVANKGIIPVVGSLEDGDEKALFGEEEDDDDYDELSPLDRTVLPEPVDLKRQLERSQPSSSASAKPNATGAATDGGIRDWEGEIDALFDSKDLE